MFAPPALQDGGDAQAVFNAVREARLLAVKVVTAGSLLRGRHCCEGERCRRFVMQADHRATGAAHRSAFQSRHATVAFPTTHPHH